MFNRGGIGSVWHFPCQFPHHMPLVTCPCAFRLRHGIRARHFPSTFPHKMPLVTCPCACRARRLAQIAGRGISVRHVASKCLHKMPFVSRPCAVRKRRFAQNIARGMRVRHFPLNISAQNARCDMSMCISTAQAGTKC